MDGEQTTVKYGVFPDHLNKPDAKEVSGLNGMTLNVAPRMKWIYTKSVAQTDAASQLC